MTLNAYRKQDTYYYTNTDTLVKSFINDKFIKSRKLLLLELIKPVKLRLANDKIVGIITYAARIILASKNYLEEIYCLITPLAKFNIILRMP